MIDKPKLRSPATATLLPIQIYDILTACTDWTGLGISTNIQFRAEMNTLEQNEKIQFIFHPKSAPANSLLTFICQSFIFFCKMQVPPSHSSHR